jgi:cell division septation protein DedD
MRFLLVIVFLMASAAGMYYSGVGFFADFKETKASSKKISAVKPKFLREKLKETPPETPVYTFFETLNDPTMTRLVGLDGTLSPASPQPEKKPAVPAKIKVASLPVEKIIKPEPAAIPEKKIKANVRATPVVEGPPRYAVQVGSFKDEKRAGTLKMLLQKKGHDAFLMQIEVADSAWHRVFLGRYADEKKAQDAAQSARNDFNLNAVVVSKTN